eukprot:gene801-442_t
MDPVIIVFYFVFGAHTFLLRSVAVEPPRVTPHAPSSLPCAARLGWDLDLRRRGTDPSIEPLRDGCAPLCCAPPSTLHLRLSALSSSSPSFCPYSFCFHSHPSPFPFTMSGLPKYFPNAKKFVRKDGTEVAMESLAGKLVFFYFSASWCPPCRGFTPQLAEFYSKYKDAKNFEIIWISWDEEKGDYTGYFEKMPWMALPSRTALFAVESIPTLVGVEADTGKVVTTTARARLVQDPEGAQFPWSS